MQLYKKTHERLDLLANNADARTCGKARLPSASTPNTAGHSAILTPDGLSCVLQVSASVRVRVCACALSSPGQDACFVSGVRERAGGRGIGGDEIVKHSGQCLCIAHAQALAEARSSAPPGR